VKKDILSLLDLTRDEIQNLMQRALELKQNSRRGIRETPLTGKTLGLVFEKASTRTRLSFEAAMIQLGGSAIFIKTAETQMGRDEPIRDTARVMARYLDGLAIRTYAQANLEEFAEYAVIPVINALSDHYHPCQILSDVMTVLEARADLDKLRIAWVGDGNNVSHSWINIAAVLGLDLILACPKGYLPDDTVLKNARERHCGSISVTSDPIEAVRGVDVINTDVWASMGQESEQMKRSPVFEPFQVNRALLEHADPDAIVLHCLPAHRGEEITDAVLEGPQSVVWDQAENKLHMHKAVLEWLLG